MIGPGKRFRDLQRILHLVATAVRIAAFPILVVTGSAMWHQARLRRLLRQERRSPMGST